MSEWKEILLGEVVEVVNGFAFKSSDFLESKIDDSLPVIKIKNVANGDVHLNGCQFHKYDQKLDRFVVESGDVLLALTGNHPEVMTQVVGEASRYKLSEKAFLNQRVAKVLPKDWDLLSNDFLYYFLKDDNTHDYLASQSTGSANQANISKVDIENIPLNLPPLPEQQAIAEVLSSLDDKIDLLHRQNKTLEQLAETLFRQWFLPASAGQAGVEEELNGTLGEYIKVQNGYAFKSKDFKEKGYAGVIKIRNISMGSIDITNHDCVDENVVKNLDRKFKLKTGDFLIAMTGAEIGKIGIIEKTEKEIWLNQRVGKLEAKVPYGDLIGYLVLKSREGQEHIMNACAGSAQENISSAGIEEMNFVTYDKQKADSFGKEVKPLFEKIIFNQGQIRTLTQLRDTLLPKLMSGEIRLNRT